MKDKNKLLKNITDEELLKEVANRKLQSKNGFPDPIPAQCFRCQKQFWIRWVNTKQRYSVKNNLDYYTEKETDKDLKICNFHLRSLYFDKPTYWKTVQNLRKRAVLARYINLDLV